MVQGSGFIICCAKRTMSPRGPLADTFLGTPFGSSSCHLQQKGVPRKVSTSGLRGDIVRFAQQYSATRCPLDPLLPSQNSVSANISVALVGSANPRCGTLLDLPDLTRRYLRVGQDKLRIYPPISTLSLSHLDEISFAGD